jgi:excisionase family DNA binding protein
VLSTTKVAEMADTTRYTVEREIERGNLAAEKVGRTWVIQQDEADRWAAQFRPYAALRGRRQVDARPVRHVSPG